MRLLFKPIIRNITVFWRPAAQDYEAFYQAEIGYRLLMDYPPAAFMTAIRGSCKNEELLKQAMEYCRKYIEKIYKKEDLILVGRCSGSCCKGAGLL